MTPFTPGAQTLRPRTPDVNVEDAKTETIKIQTNKKVAPATHTPTLKSGVWGGPLWIIYPINVVAI